MSAKNEVCETEMALSLDHGTSTSPCVGRTRKNWVGRPSGQAALRRGNSSEHGDLHAASISACKRHWNHVLLREKGSYKPVNVLTEREKKSIFQHHPHHSHLSPSLSEFSFKIQTLKCDHRRLYTISILQTSL